MPASRYINLPTSGRRWQRSPSSASITIRPPYRQQLPSFPGFPLQHNRQDEVLRRPRPRRRRPGHTCQRVQGERVQGRGAVHAGLQLGLALHDQLRAEQGRRLHPVRARRADHHQQHHPGPRRGLQRARRPRGSRLHQWLQRRRSLHRPLLHHARQRVPQMRRYLSDWPR